MIKIKEILATPFLIIAFLLNWIGALIMGKEAYLAYVHSVASDFHKFFHGHKLDLKDLIEEEEDENNK